MSTLELENIKHPDNSGDNIALASNGSITIDRKSTDGTIAEFRKDGTSVGSIGTVSNTVGIHGAGSGDDAVGLLFVESGSGQRIVPCQQNFTSNNGIVNLGWSTNRFKDLYLSGGIYLGGTAAANKLDDYEEGTWTAVDGSGNAYNPGAHATYTKIGRIVYINFDISATASTSGHQIAGLPFTASPTSVTANWSVYGGYSTSNADLWGHINASTNVIGMFVGHVSHTLNGRWIGAGFYYTEQ
jgi:hypothetical protein